MSVGLNLLCEVAQNELITDLKQKYEKITEKKSDIVKQFPKCVCVSDSLYIRVNESGLLTSLDNFITAIQNIDTYTDFVVCFLKIIQIPTSKPGHCNIFIYDKSQNRVEKFEPNGMNTSNPSTDGVYDMKNLDDEIYQKFEQMKIKYTKSEYFLPANGPQCFELTSSKETGFCVVWCILYLFLRIAFPEQSLNDLVIDMKSFIKNKPNKIENIVNFFHMFIKE